MPHHSCGRAPRGCGYVGINRSQYTGSVLGQTPLLFLVGQAVFSNLKETERQRLRSEEWYRPQLNLAQWVEAEIPVDKVLVPTTSLPVGFDAVKLKEMISWFDVPASGGDEQALQHGSRRMMFDGCCGTARNGRDLLLLPVLGRRVRGARWG